MAISLSRKNLPSLDPRVAVPRYEPGDLAPGIVHFGIGNFHRSHQGVYLDRLFNRGLDRDWAIVGAGVTATDAAMRQDLLAQDLLTTVVAQEAATTEAQVIAPMVGFVAPGDAEGVIAVLADKRTRIVSLTVTEGGYYIDPSTQAFQAAHPAIVADAASGLTRPKSVFGLIAAGLLRRRERGLPPFTVLSCDNLQGNGDVAREAVAGVVGLARLRDAEWIREAVAFPNSMVDRITPATSDRERQLLRDGFGIDDSRPVFCEGFLQWVVEDRFAAGRPQLQEVGVQFVGDVAPFELMKIRVLNGGHAAIAYAAGLLDIDFAHEAMADAQIARFLSLLLEREIVPLVPPVPGTDLRTYKSRVEERFANPKIGDTIRRLCHDGSNRQPKFILPSIRDAVAAGRPVAGLALVSALWCRYCFGETESGGAIAPNDPIWSSLTERARRARSFPEAWLAMSEVYGVLASHEAFRVAFAEALRRLWRDGARAALDAFIRS
jgi:mannitol 2-dehydrogenase